MAAARVALRVPDHLLADAVTGPDGRFQLRVDVVGEMAETSRPMLVVSAPKMATLHATPPGRGPLVSGDLGDLMLASGPRISGAVHGEDGESVAKARIVLEPS